MKNFFIIFLCIATLFGCAVGSSSEISSIAEAEPPMPFQSTAKVLEVVLPETIAQQLSPLFKLYETEQGITVNKTVLSDLEFDTDYIVALGESKAGLFISKSGYQATGLGQIGGAYNISRNSSVLVSSLAQAVPEDLKTDGEMFFLPAGIDGYGYLTDISRLGTLFGEDDLKSLAENLIGASSRQWQTAVRQIYAVTNGSAKASATVKLSSAEYTMAAKLPTPLSGVVAPYALAVGELSVYLPPLSTAMRAAASQQERHDEIYTAYVDFLAEETAMVAAGDKELLRGSKFAVNYDKLNTAAAAEIFKEKKTLFWRERISTAYINLPQDMLNDIVVFPQKLAIEAEILNDSLLSYALNSSITLTTPFGFGLAITEDVLQQEAAIDFIVWFYYSTVGKAYIEDTLGLLNFNSPTAKTPLALQLLGYIDAKRTIPDTLLFAPPQTTEEIADVVYSDYMTEVLWTPQLRLALAGSLTKTFE